MSDALLFQMIQFLENYLETLASIEDRLDRIVDATNAIADSYATSLEAADCRTPDLPFETSSTIPEQEGTE